MKGNGPPSVADVNTHARELVEKMASKNGVPVGEGQLDKATAAAMMPDFSRGTVALDEDTGAPIVGQTPVALPDAGEAGGTTDALAGAKAEIAGEAAPVAAVTSKERDPASGRYVSEAAADVSDAATAPPAAAPEAKPTGEQAAETAAQAILDRPDPWADYEEVEIEDADLGTTYKVRAPKAEAAAVKGGYMRRADYSRKTMFLGDLKKTFEPLVGDGRLKAILPLIERAVADPEYGNFVVDAYNRRIAGQPLTPAQAAAAEAGAAVQAAAAPAAPVTQLTEAEDPFLAEALRPYNERLGQVTSLVERMAAQETARAAQEDLGRRQYEQRVAVGNQAYAALCQRYGDEFSGDQQKDSAAFMRAVNYGRDSGIFQQYGENPASIVLAYEDLRRARQEATASPAVAAVNAATERRVASANAASVAPGTPAAAPQRKVVPPPPATRANGVAVDPKLFAQQALARRAAIAAGQQ